MFDFKDDDTIHRRFLPNGLFIDFIVFQVLTYFFVKHFYLPLFYLSLWISSSYRHFEYNRKEKNTVETPVRGTKSMCVYILYPCT